MTQRVLVTGANGFVGRRLCAAFLTHGWDVRAGIRGTDGRGTVLVGNPHVVPAEAMTSVQGWAPAVERCDVVVHLIAKTHGDAVGGIDMFRRVNVDITAALLEASQNAGVSRFLYMSSIKAVGEGAREAYDEDALCRPEDPYGQTKLEAEHVVSQRSSAALIVRPPLVYGPGVRGNFRRLMDAVAARRLLPFGRLTTRRSMVYVDNLSDAVLSLVSGNHCGTFHVADPGPWSVVELINELAMRLEVHPRLLPVPPRALELVGRVSGRSKEVKKFTRPLVVDGAKLRSVAGWEAPHSRSDALDRTVSWYLAAQEH